MHNDLATEAAQVPILIPCTNCSAPFDPTHIPAHVYDPYDRFHKYPNYATICPSCFAEELAKRTRPPSQATNTSASGGRPPSQERPSTSSDVIIRLSGGIFEDDDAADFDDANGRRNDPSVFERSDSGAAFGSEGSRSIYSARHHRNKHGSIATTTTTVSRSASTSRIGSGSRRQRSSIQSLPAHGSNNSSQPDLHRRGMSVDHSRRSVDTWSRGSRHSPPQQRLSSAMSVGQAIPESQMQAQTQTQTQAQSATASSANPESTGPAESRPSTARYSPPDLSHLYHPPTPSLTSGTTATHRPSTSHDSSTHQSRKSSDSRKEEMVKRKVSFRRGVPVPKAYHPMAPPSLQLQSILGGGSAGTGTGTGTGIGTGAGASTRASSPGAGIGSASGATGNEIFVMRPRSQSYEGGDELDPEPEMHIDVEAEDKESKGWIGKWREQRQEKRAKRKRQKEEREHQQILKRQREDAERGIGVDIFCPSCRIVVRTIPQWTEGSCCVFTLFTLTVCLGPLSLALLHPICSPHIKDVKGLCPHCSTTLSTWIRRTNSLILHSWTGFADPATILPSYPSNTMFGRSSIRPQTSGGPRPLTSAASSRPRAPSSSVPSRASGNIRNGARGRAGTVGTAGTTATYLTSSSSNVAPTTGSSNLAGSSNTASSGADTFGEVEVFRDIRTGQLVELQSVGRAIG